MFPRVHPPQVRGGCGRGREEAALSLGPSGHGLMAPQTKKPGKKKKSSVILSDNQVEASSLLRAVGDLHQPEKDLQGGRARNRLLVISRKGMLRDSYQPRWLELDALRAGLVLQHKLPDRVAHSQAGII